MEIKYIYTTKDLFDYINNRIDIADLSSMYLVYKLSEIHSSPYTVDSINMRNKIEKELEFRDITSLIKSVK